MLFRSDLIPSVAVDSSLDEITPPDAPITPTDLVLATNALDSVQQDTSCLPTSASWDDFLPAIAQLFVESHIEDVGDILDDIHLLFEVNYIATVTDSCTSTLQGTHGLLRNDCLPNISALFLESHIVDMGDFYDDLSSLC